MGPSWWIDERKEGKKCCRGRARELIGVNWLLLFWPEAEKRDKSQDKGKKVCVLQGCNYKERRATRRRGERISFGLTKGRPEVRREKNKERWQVHTHIVQRTYFTPVEQQHVLPTITSMNHCLPSGDGAQGGLRGMTGRRNDERNVWHAQAKRSEKVLGKRGNAKVNGGGAEANVLQVP